MVDDAFSTDCVHDGKDVDDLSTPERHHVLSSALTDEKVAFDVDLGDLFEGATVSNPRCLRKPPPGEGPTVSHSSSVRLSEDPLVMTPALFGG